MAYDYVRRMYGVAPVPGERIRCHSSGRFATIMRPRPEDQYVHARIDGEKHRSRFHPLSVDYLRAVEPGAAGGGGEC